VRDPAYVAFSDPSLYKGLRVTVMGWGRFGGNASAARFLAEQGAQVTVTDLKPPEAFPPLPTDFPCQWVFGGHRQEDFDRADVILVSPAVPPHSPFLRKAVQAGSLLDTEMNLFLRLCKAHKIVGITGSNGKSTTTSLVAAMAAEGAFSAHCGGNVGRSLLEEWEGIGADDVVVLELSSFQIERMTEAGLGVWGALLLNLKPNHLDWHGSWEAYRDAKAGLLETVDPSGWVLLNGRDPELLQCAFRSRVRVHRFGREPSCLSWTDGERVWCGEEGAHQELCEGKEIALRGRHNLDNVAAAAGASVLIGADLSSIREAVLKFVPLPHRLEPCGERGGVLWVNDSVSTTPESALAALEAFQEPIHLILGGKDKGLGTLELVKAVSERCKRVVLIGAMAEALQEELRREGCAGERCRVCATLPEAVSLSSKDALPGDVVLFSPGFSSYDMFLNFEERGESFKRAVAALR